MLPTGPPTGHRCCTRPACRASSPPVMCAAARSNGSPRPWATALPPSHLCTAIWKAWRPPRSREGSAMNTSMIRCTEPDQPRELVRPGGPAGSLPAGAALRPLVPGMRRLLLVAAVLVLLAGLQLFVFTGHTSTFFAWTIANPLSAAFLGASYWAAVSIEALAGRQKLWANARIAVPAVFVFTVLTLATTLMHLGQFHLGGRFPAGTRIVTIAWIAIYVLVPLLMLVVLFVQMRTPGADPPRSAGLPAWMYALLGGQAVVLLGLGVALFAAPGHAAPLWPWKLTPLVAQATGAWLISLGVAAGHSLLERDGRRLRPAALGYILLALLQAIALARYPHQFAWGSTSGRVYLVFLGAMLLTGAVGLATLTIRHDGTR